ncbi:MAG TPA: acyltransferase family protein [Kineosporiaceae bacterium]|nr:acyltransferase family protein [Kineosporiaceae bacterium]
MSGRILWIDAARGLAIVLVTLIHATDWIQETSVRIPVWVDVNEVLSTLRMPLFFACAGILAAKWVTAGWSELVPRKIGFLVWVYLIWQPVGSLVALIAARFNGDEFTLVRMIGSLALTPFRPRFELWFLWSLALFFVLARASARLPRTPQIVVAAGIAAVWFSALIPEHNLGWDGSAKYYVFFLLGCYHRPALEGFVQHLGFEASLLLIGGWFVLAAFAYTSGLDDLPGVGLLVRVVGVAAGFALARRLMSVTLLSYLGSRTLPIYLAHTPLIICFTWVLSIGLGDGLPDPVIAVLPVLFTVVSVALSLLLHFALTSNSAGALLYAPPAAVVGWMKRLFSGRRPPPAPMVIDLRTPAAPRRSIRMTEVPIGPPVAELEPRW